MVKLDEITDYCLSKPGAFIDFPFGDVPMCIKYNGSIFAEIYPCRDNYKITLRCEPEKGEYYRQEYPGVIIPGYHVPLRQRKYKNTILLNNGIITKKLISRLIDESYCTLLKNKRGKNEG